MKIKVCGMREPENIAQLAQLPIDWMGFIFHKASPRYAGGLPPDALCALPERIKRVGVFVNAPVDEMTATAERYGLHAIQLHGDETPEVCRALRERQFEAIKAFPVAEAVDFEQTASYEGCCDYFLFDTKTPLHGGSGRAFDWSLLRHYTGNTPFLLSGGIGEESLCALKTLTHPAWVGVDLNSRFETRPGQKNRTAIKRFIEAFLIGTI